MLMGRYDELLHLVRSILGMLSESQGNRLNEFSCYLGFVRSVLICAVHQCCGYGSRSGRIRNFPDPEKIAPDPGNSGSEMNFK